MKKERTQAQKKKLKTAIISVCSCVVLLGTTTFAWFTLTNQATVNQLTLTAGTTGGLLIGTTAANVSENPVTLTNDANYCIKPLTSSDGIDFYKPLYEGSDGKVSSISTTKETISNIKNKPESEGGYMVQFPIFLKANDPSTTTAKNVNICLNGAGSKVVNNVSSKTGAETAIRISFQVKEAATATVYEPNADKTITGATETQLNSDNMAPTIKQNAALKFQKDSSYTPGQDISDPVFSIPVNTATEITMNIWLEGADKECVNDIMRDVIKADLQFICPDLN